MKQSLSLAINPNFAMAHYNLGVAYYGNKGLDDEAILEFKEAIAINPNHAEAHYNLGVTYGDKGMFDEAILECKKAMLSIPTLPWRTITLE